MTMLDDPVLRPHDVTRQLGFWLRRAQASVWQDLIRSFAPFEIKPQQYAILAHVHVSPGARLEAIGRALRVQPPNLVAFVEDLVSRGLVARGKDASDRRVNTLALTRDGERLLDRLARRDDLHEQALVDLLGETRLQALMDDLRLLAGFRSAAAVPAAPPAA